MLSETPIVKTQSETEQPADGKNHDIQIIGASLDYEYSIPVLYIDYKNNTNSDIIRFDICVNCYDAYGNRLDSTYKGYNMKKLLANSEDSQYWDLYLYSGVQEARFAVYKYQTADGKTIEIPENEQKWYRVTY